MTIGTAGLRRKIRGLENTTPVSEEQETRRREITQEDIDKDHPEYVRADIKDNPYHVMQSVNPANLEEQYIILKFNGAKILKAHCPLPTCISKVEDGRIEYISFTLHEDIKYLGQIFDRTPYGVLDKKRTGIGATTLELDSPRNSIIVVPTKTLAYTKWLKNESNYKYIGSPISKIKQNATQAIINKYLDEIDYLNTTYKGIYKKFLVVADSLPKLVEALEKKGVLGDYFLMIDEVDVIQSDSTYRPNLENTIDYYFGKFDYRNRSLVSATIKGFSHPKIKEEANIKADFVNEGTKREPCLVHTNNPNKVVADHINRLTDEGTGRPILVAYNSINDILEVISLLNPEHGSKCGIMCSEKSKKKVEYHTTGSYMELDAEHFPTDKQIIFMTCTYFVGIDIKDKFHLISVANVDVPYTLLSTNKLTQIKGRCRHSDGTYSDTIIYSTKNAKDILDIEDYLEAYKSKILDSAGKVASFYNEIDKFCKDTNKEKEARYKKIFDKIKPVIQKEAVEYVGSTKVPLTRQNCITKEYEISYFNHDALVDLKELEIGLYSDKAHLGECYGVKVNEEVQPFTKEQMKNRDQISSDNKELTDEEIRESNDKIRNLFEVGDFNEDELKILKMEAPNSMIGRYYDRVIELHEYISLENIFELLEENPYITKYINIHNGIIFKALADGNPFKSTVLSFVQEDGEFKGSKKQLTSNQIVEFMQDVVSQILGRNDLENDALKIFLNSFFDNKSGRTGRGFYDYACKYEILNPIETTDTYKYFKFVGD